MVSIIVPVYKVEKYLKNCIESILAQTYKDFELILVDDGSPDSSGAICDEYAKKDSRIKVFHKENGGASSARNTGLKFAQGEFINFVDSDDTIPVDSLENLVNLQKENNADLVCCTYQAYKGNKFLGKVSFYDKYVDFSKVELSASKVFFSNSFSGPCTKLYKSDIIKNNNIMFDITARTGEDTIFVYEYLAKCKSVQCGDIVVYNYLKNDYSTTATMFENFDEYIIIIVEKKISFYSTLNMSDGIKSCYNICAIICDLVYVINHYLEHFGIKFTIDKATSFYEKFKPYFSSENKELEEFLTAHNNTWFKPYTTYKILTLENGVEKLCKYKLKQKRKADFKKQLKKIKIINSINDLIKGRK